MIVSLRSTRRSPPAGTGSAVVERAQRGDAQALEALATHLLPQARNLVRYLVRDDHDVDDIVQDALVAVLRNLDSYRGDGTLKSWVDRVVARTTFAWLRKRNLDFERVQHLAADPNVAVSEPTPETEAYLARRRMIQQLDALPLNQRHALVLHHVVGMTVPEVAAAVGTSPNTVRSRLRLGKQKLLAWCSSRSLREVV